MTVLEADRSPAVPQRPSIIPIDLGGSPTRSDLDPPRRPLPTPELVEAMIAHYRSERAVRGRLEVAFFHGGLPDDALLAAAGGLPVRVACSPADLTRSEAARLWAAGARTIELAVGSFDAGVLRTNRLGFRWDLPIVMLRELADLGFSTGITLTPGLPASSHETALASAGVIADPAHPLVDFVRIHPALALAGSHLAALVDSQRWVPMSLPEAITTTLAMVERLEDAGVRIARLGLQPGQDIPCRAVAGPYHPNLRQLVEVRRFYGRLAHELALVPRGSRVEVKVNPRDLTWARGTANANIRRLRAERALAALQIHPDEAIPRGDVHLAGVS